MALTVAPKSQPKATLPAEIESHTHISLSQFRPASNGPALAQMTPQEGLKKGFKRPENLIMRESYLSNGPTSPPLVANRHQYLSDDFSSSPSAAHDEINQVEEDCDYSELMRVA